MRRRLSMLRKFCSRCKKQKLLSAFHKNRTAKDGYQGTCRQCHLDVKAKHREHCKKQGILSHTQQNRRRLRLEVLQAYGGEHPACACCKTADIEFLCIDHINGGGGVHRRQIGHSGLYTWLKREGFPQGFRVLCYNCNASLAAYGYCPHRAEGNSQLTQPYLRRPSSEVNTLVVAAVASLHKKQQPLTLTAIAKAAGVATTSVAICKARLIEQGCWPGCH